MPHLNGTGPDAKGTKTGRGIGLCKARMEESDISRLGTGAGKRRKSGGGNGKGKRLKSDQI